uniref:Small ribosomal subunit protein uS8c n=1 Tax=Thismia tentaculata TaxID=1841234 RepID=A0A1B0ZF25_9LILI|nr:ribosomal protein S8 [Thismia tentaculata]
MYSMQINNILNTINSIKYLYYSKSKKKKIIIIFTNITNFLIKKFIEEGFIKNIRKYKKKKLSFIFKKYKKKYYKLLLKQISRPSLRIYSNYKKIPKYLGGVGIIYFSTCKGIIKDQEVKLNKIGGEVLYYIW